MRTIETIRNTKPDGTVVKARIRYDSDVAEYVVDFYVQSAGSSQFHKHKDADYFTPDKDDAINTAKWWAGVK